MKCLLYNKYGGVENLYWTNRDIALPLNSEILIKIQAISINPVDWKIRNGQMNNLVDNKFPKGIGLDFSGTVMAIGASVSRFKIGDEIFGWLPYNEAGSIAEMINVNEKYIVRKPTNISFGEAASIPMGALAALTALQDYGNIQYGMKVLINGCTGGVGQFAVMIAKKYDCSVTGICSTNSINMAFKIGVDNVIDYNKFNILNSDQKYDMILDNVGNLKFKDSKGLLTKFGVFLEMNVTLLNYLLGPIINKFSLKKVKSVATSGSLEKLERISQMASMGFILPVIGKVYSFDSAIQAFSNVEKGEQVQGKTIIVV